MKTRLLFVCCILIATASPAQKRIIDIPHFTSSNHKNLMVEQIELSDTATILRMKINYDPQKFWSINPESYILADDGTKPLKIKYAQGILLGERMYTKSGTSLFSLYFPPVDATAKKIDFIESDCDACYKIRGIDLNTEGIDKLMNNSEYQAKTMPGEATVSTIPTGSIPQEEIVEPAPKSSVSCDGSQYNLVFSWKKKKFDPHWTGLGIALATLDGMNDTNADLTLSTSYSIVFNPIDYYIPLSRNWMLVSGVGIDWTRYHFKDNMGLEEIDGITQFVPAPDGINYKSSKLLTYYITLPLLFEYQPGVSKKNRPYISGGIVGYIKCYSKSQVDYKIEGDVDKVNKGRDLNILPVNARFMLQAGMKNLSIYAYYSPFSLFEKSKGPDLKPMGIGVLMDF